jgi:hypothetical protein
MGAQEGNIHWRGKIWTDALRRALARAEQDPAASHRTVNALAERFLEKAAEGDLMAMREIADRLEGKPAQAIVGDADAPAIRHTFSWKNESQ